MKKIIILITLTCGNFMQQCSQTLVPHPRTFLIKACLMRENNDDEARAITHIIEEYTKEDSLLEAQSDKYYACTEKGRWISDKVVVYNQNGNVLKNFKAPNIIEIGFSPDNNLLSVLHAARSSDSGFLFTGYWFQAPIITTFCLHDNYSVACTPGELDSWQSDEHIKKCNSQKVPAQQRFMRMMHGKLQEKRQNSIWWSNLFHSLTETRLINKALDPFVSRILPSAYKIFQRTSPQ
jgi:hypothetical protein